MALMKKVRCRSFRFNAIFFSMDATIHLQRIRQALDDKPENGRKKGYFWTDDDIVTALNLSLDAVVYFLCRKDALYLLQGLITSVAASGSTAVPNDYFYRIAGKVQREALGDYKPARLFLCGIGLANWNVGYSGVYINSGGVYFRKDKGFANGMLVYCKKPSRMAITGAAQSEPDDLPKAVYDIVVAHATACLAVRQEPTARHIKNFNQALQFALNDSARQLPTGLNENTSV